MLKDSEIKNAIELFVNCIYNGESDWLKADKDEWAESVWSELSSWKETKFGCYKSHENRFNGKVNVMKRIYEMLDQTFIRLENEGYKFEVN